MSDRIRKLLDERYSARRKQLHAVVTAAPMVDGRSAGYVVATVAGVPGVRVNVSPDLRAPFVANDTIIVEGVGTPAAMGYWAVGRTGGARTNSDAYIFPSTTAIGSSSYEAGDILLGSTLADWSNWWYQFALGRWQIRQGTTMQGAIGNLTGLYDYTDDGAVYGNAFGLYAPGAAWIATDPLNGLRIMSYRSRVFQVNPLGIATFGLPDQAEIVIDPTSGEIVFSVGGVAQSAISANTRTIYGIERLGRPLGPNIEWGSIPDPSNLESLERFGFWMRNLGGDRFFAILSGTEADPDSASFRVGSQGDENYLEYQNGELNVVGTIRADSGTIGGFTISDTDLASVGNFVKLIGASSEAFGEGVILLSGEGWSTSGSLCWKTSNGVVTILDTAGEILTGKTLRSASIWPTETDSGAVYTFNMFTQPYGTEGSHSNSVYFHDTKVEFNANGDDNDFVIKGSTEDELVFVDASTDTVYLGGTTNGIKIEKGGALSTIGTGRVMVGWLPYAYLDGYGPLSSNGTDIDINADGATLVGITVLGAPMLLESASAYFKDTSGAERSWNWALYVQATNTGDADENTLTRVAYGAAADTWSPSAAGTRTITAEGAPVTLAPGAYWFLIQNVHASNTLKIGCAAGTTNAYAMQRKACTNPVGATLDFVAATWTRVTYLHSGRLNGRVFGETAAF